jgi:antirestriction protein ArdC
MKSTAVFEKTDVYTIVTNKIVEQLEKGVVPWKQPWTDTGIPQNLITRKPYRGINVWLLSMLGYMQNYFLTWRQIKGVGGCVKQGAKPHIIVFWRWVVTNNKGHDQESTELVVTKPRKKAYLRYYYVYNVAQCEKIPIRLFPTMDRNNSHIEICEDIVYDMPNRPPIVHDQPAAYYDPKNDRINMPKMGMFKDSVSYYETLFHELVHSTGHSTRLNRKELVGWGPFGSEPYSFEELIAEIGACYLTSFAGIAEPQLSNNVAYLQGWLSRLQNDSRFIINASSKAQQAVDFILKIKHADTERDVTEILVDNE